MSEYLQEVKDDLKLISEREGDVLCRAALQEIEELEAKLAQQDDLVQAAVAAALREAADAVEDYCSDAPDLAGHGHSGAIRDIITAIRKGGE